MSVSNQESNSVPSLYWWHFGKEESEDLCSLASSYFYRFSKECPTFSKWLIRHFPGCPKEDVNQFYNREYSKTPERDTLHVTAYFSGPDSPRNDAIAYSERPTVKTSLNQAFNMDIIGFFITPQTFGGRVRLGAEQLMLYSMDDDEDGTSKSEPDHFLLFLNKLEKRFRSESIEFPSGTVVEEVTETVTATKETSSDELRSMQAPRTRHASERADFPKPEIPVIMKKARLTLQDGEILSNFRPIRGLGSRAHVTLGCAKGVPPVTTGFDLVKLVRLEQSEDAASLETFELESGWLRCYDEEGWMFYPKNHYLVPGVFKAVER